MPNATLDERQGKRLGELQDWYLGGLRPKLAQAARSGSVESSAVLALDRQMRDLLALPEAERKAA